MHRALSSGRAISCETPDLVHFLSLTVHDGYCGAVADLSHRRRAMSTRVSPVPLPELAAAAPLDHIEAVTIVREVVQRVGGGELPGVPSAHVIRLSASGALSVEGPIAAGGFPVRRAAHLLETLLPDFGSELRVPGALRLIVARALGTLDLPPYASLESFALALSRFAAIDPWECFRQIVANRPGAPGAQVAAEGVARPLDMAITVSDIRRARRATGVPLSEISRRSRIPAHLLRELEWGYFENWPGSHIGRRLIIGYARVTGLDEQLVTRTLWPLLEESVRHRGTLGLEERPPLPVVVEVMVEHAPPENVTGMTLARIEPVARRRWDTRRIVAVLTIPALLAIGAAPALWQHSAAARRETQRQVTETAVRVVQRPVREIEAGVRETEVTVARPLAPGTPVHTSGVIIRQAAYRPKQPAAVKSNRPSAAKSTQAPQVRRATSGNKGGPRKWGIWVLNKVGVRIVNTEQ